MGASLSAVRMSTTDAAGESCGSFVITSSDNRHELTFLRPKLLGAQFSCFDRAGVLLSVAECLRGFVIIHEELRSFPEIFLPISSLLQQILDKSDLTGLLQDIFHEVIDLIKKRSEEHHASGEPLQMRKQKPEPIKQLNPKFEDNYIKGLDYDPDRERAQMKKLKKRLKSEKKGAMRELRKDNYFLSAVKEKESIKQEQERVEKYGKAMAFLQEQEHAFKSGQLGKGTKRRR